jgi:RHS repeat-associated protein
MKENNIPFRMRTIFLCVLIPLMCFLKVQAGIITYLGTGLTVGGTPNFQLNNTDSVNDGLPSSMTYGSMQGIVTFGIDWDQMTMNSTYPANQSYIVEIVVAVKGWNPAGTMIINTNETLTVKYNPVINVTEVDRGIYSCSGVRRLHAKISSIKVNGIPKLSTADILPKHIYLRTSLIIERYATFNTATVCSSWVSTSQGLGNTKNIQWSSMAGAEEYDVEWTYVDQYATPQAFDFVNNSTRVTVPASYTNYQIPVIYPSGKIVFRVRGRGRDLSAAPYTKISYGTWTATGDSASVSSLSTNYNFTLTAIEPDKNWQYTISFAEEAKQKQMISYFDGTQRNRQSVTFLNTDQVAIVGQTIYDQTGRPAIQTLPVPAYTLSHGVQVAVITLTYKNDFNQDQGGNNYAWDDFDTSHTSCNVITESMKTSSGSAMYYSGNNPLKNNTVANIYNFLPDANGYPFTQVEYMPDNTNRVRRQSGVGINHRLTGKDESNNDHVGKETKYYYATPFQKQLDRLFGNEVGFYKHYKKNAVIDANGQISISYLDPQGRVIATALGGDTTNTPNLQSLGSANTSTTLTVDLLDQTEVSYQDMSITATSTHFVTTAGTHSFSYTVATPSYKTCLPVGWCFDCVYDLTVSVKDECGNELVPDSVSHKTVGTMNNHTCDSITFSINPSPLNLSLSVGSYVVCKKLRVNQATLDYYTEQFLENSPCILPLDSFIAEEMDKIDTMECYGGCDECLARLGTYSSHSNASLQYDPNYDYMTQAQYDEAKEKCNKLCEAKTPCDILYEQMKNDVSPGGQYATYNNSTYAVTDNYSLLKTSGGYLGSYTGISTYHNFDGSTSSVNISNTAYAPANLTVQLFVQNWQTSWAEDLVGYHPEYCYYEYCLAHENSYIYDMNMMNTATFLAANDSGFVNPIWTSGDTTHFHPRHKDPYFFNGGTPNSLHPTMDDSLDHFVTAPSLYDLWGFIDYIQDNHMNANCGTNSCWSDYDWSMFRGGYLSEKQKIWKAQVTAITGCPDFNGNPNAFTSNLKLPRYVFDAFGSLGNDSLTHNDINITNNSSPQAITTAAAGFIDGNCDTICSAYAEEWMYRIRKCAGMSDPDSVEIRNRLIDACRGNCDADNPLGGVEYDEVDAILIDVLGAGYANDTCNAIGIVQPVQNGPGAFGMVPMDQCACDKVLAAHVQFDTLAATGNLPAGICSEQQMFTSLFGNNANMANFDQLECFCLQQGLIANDTIITSSSAGPVTTIVAPNCDAIMNYYVQSSTDTAELFIQQMVMLFNQHWALDSCHEGTYNLSDLNLPIDFLQTSCSSCFTTYTTDMLSSGPSPNAVKFTLHNSCGSDCSFILTDYSDPFDPFTPCTNNLTIRPPANINSNASQDSMFVGTWIDPYGPGLYVNIFYGNYVTDSARMYFWTDCFSMNTEVYCSTSFDTTMYVPYTLACEQCLTCALIDTAYAHLVNDYPFIASMGAADTVHIIHYLNTFINQNYHQNFSVIQLMDQLEQCSSSSNPDTLEFCYEPMFTNYNNPNNECVDFLIRTALSNAESHYHSYIDSVSAAFRDAFIKKCLSPVETFTMGFTDKEFHYTLYYYDQAGNLIKTVPPAGVVPITVTNTLDSVQKYRLNISSIRIMPKHKLITNYKYTTLNQPAEQRTPDGGLTKYWYDILGRLVISQNDQQQNSGYYSYTKYDDLGRIKEVGQVLRNDTVMNETKAANVFYLNNWISAGTKTEITKTVYDKRKLSVLAKFTDGQINLRNRIAYTTYAESYNAQDTIYDNATHYSYDIHGNVKEILQDNPFFTIQSQQFKTIFYTYDLVSGNVLTVTYQYKQKDQYFHKYSYDADNRLLTAQTSRENTLWDLDARYVYYLHGPLARVELGDNKVQGMDYAYTIHGWIKGINSNTLQIHRDMGGDARASTTHAKFARDAASYSIGYYEGYTTGSVTYPADYVGIRSYGLDTQFVISTTSVGSNVIATSQVSLFNGNISYMVTGLPNCSTYNASYTLDPDPLGSVYRYDQLNRIVKMKAFLDKSYLVTNNKWNTTSANAGMTYFNKYSYDANGNLLQLHRRGDQSGSNLSQDSLNYAYATGGSGYYNGQTLNRLSSITELQTTTARYSGDIDNNSNYTYDDIGNLIGDSGEEINGIRWSVYGKVKRVIRTTGSVKSDLEFTYNSAGQRVIKLEKPRNSSGVLNQSKWVYTYYIHDAQGNIMATYTLSYKKVGGSADAPKIEERMTVNNFMMYGSSRLGTKEDTLTLSKRYFTVSTWNADSSFNGTTGTSTVTLPALDANHCNRETGYKEYELNNHLGNVQATITDRKVQVSSTPFTTITSWLPDVNTIYDYYPFGAPMPGRNLALAPCSTTVSNVTNTVVNEVFTGNTGSFSAISSTLSGTTNVLVMTKTGSPANYGASRTFTHINGVVYNVSFTLGLGTCSGQTITVKVKDPSSGTITTQTYTTAGSKSFSFTATANGTGSIEFTCPGTVGTCTKFDIDNVLITYGSQSVGKACGGGIDSYMFGFNGMEKTNEVYGEGNEYTSDFRQYDPRIARWTSIDPVSKEFESSYAAYSNNPIYFVDPHGAMAEGNEAGNGDGEKTKKSVVIFSKDSEDGDPGGDPNDALETMLNQAKKGDVYIIYADTPEELQKGFDEFNKLYTLENVFAASHGNRDKAGFHLGGRSITPSNYNSGNSEKMLEVVKNNLSADSKVVILACHGGSTYNGGAEMVGNLANYFGTPVIANQSWTSSGGAFTGKSTNSLNAWKQPYNISAGTSAAYDQAGYWTVGLPSTSPMLSHVSKDLMIGDNTYRTGSLIIHSNGTLGVEMNWGETPNESNPFMTNNKLYGIMKDNQSDTFDSYIKKTN